MTTAAEPLPARFERAKSRFFAGLEAYRERRWAVAEAHYRASLDALPGRASTLINLAATLLELDRADEALGCADAAITAESDAADAWRQRGAALERLGRHADAEAAYDRLLHLDPTLVDGWLRRAHMLERLGRPENALAAFRQALAHDPASADAWSGSGGLLRELGRPVEAAQAFREAIRHGADPALHAYYLAAVGPEPAPPAAPAGYVAALFDDYADAFEAHLVGQLGYRAPAELIGALPRPPGGSRFAEALDLGCGTGLCGPLLRPIAARLTGIDLAPKMIEKARERGVYDRLEAAEIVDFLDRDATRYDLIVAADVLIYFGDLAPVHAAARRRLAPGGLYAYTVESLDAAAGREHALQPSLRYAHAEAYLRRVAAAHGFSFVALRRAPVRMDQQRPIEGSFVTLRAA